MDKDQKAWEKRSVRIVKALRYSIGIYGILVMIGLFLYNVGIPQNVDETLTACVITEEGETHPCEVRITGEATEYPLKNIIRKRSYSYGGSVTVYANDKRLGILSFDEGNDNYTHTYSHPAVCVLRRDREVFFAQTDVQKIFPEQESQGCVVIAPAENKADAISLLEAQDILDHYESEFRWILEK